MVVGVFVCVFLSKVVFIPPFIFLFLFFFVLQMDEPVDRLAAVVASADGLCASLRVWVFRTTWHVSCRVLWR